MSSASEPMVQCPSVRYTMALPMVPGDESILLAVGRLLHQEIAIDDLLKQLVDRIRRTMSADRGTIYLVDLGRREVFSKAAHLPELEEIRLSIGQGVAGHVAETGDVVNVPTTSNESRWHEGVDQQTGYTTESILAVPMRDHLQRIIGVVQLLNKQGGAFTRQDEDVLVMLAEQAALAIEATTLYEDLSRAPAADQKSLPIAGQFNRIIGESDLLRRACKLTAKAADSEATVLIRGESGTGKELFARAIHVNSPRSEGPFVKVDCAALPESLIENELFGHERGAFTGADQQAHGKFDAAQGGTLFLDELGELPLAVQGKLLRVLQDREYNRVGGTEPVRADARIVAATNRDLLKLVGEGRFRSDLYFRIKVVEIALPALRDRGPRDIERLAHHFIVAAAKHHGRNQPTLTPKALARLCDYPWPGNVRELENCMESAVVIMDGTRIAPSDLPLPKRPPLLDAKGESIEEESHGQPFTHPDGTVRTLDDVEREHILYVLDQSEGNRTLAAKMLGIGRNTLSRKLKKYGC